MSSSRLLDGTEDRASAHHIGENEHRQPLREASDAPTDIVSTIRASILASLPDADVDVWGSGGHFSIDVVADLFAEKSTLERQRLVYRAIAPLMTGDHAPVHAVDRLITRVRG